MKYKLISPGEEAQNEMISVGTKKSIRDRLMNGESIEGLVETRGVRFEGHDSGWVPSSLLVKVDELIDIIKAESEVY